MFQVIIVFHVLIGIGIIGLIMMQQGKGADAGAAFGSGASGTVFGAQGAASFLSRTTAVLAILFFTTSLGLAILSGHQDEPQDLMDVPLVEEKLLDVPVVSDSEAPLTVPSIADQEILEDIPTVEVIPEVSAEQPTAEIDVVPVEQPVKEATSEESVEIQEVPVTIEE